MLQRFAEDEVAEDDQGGGEAVPLLSAAGDEELLTLDVVEAAEDGDDEKGQACGGAMAWQPCMEAAWAREEARCVQRDLRASSCGAGPCTPFSGNGGVRT